jgi:FkbM family methyltransferase
MLKYKYWIIRFFVGVYVIVNNLFCNYWYNVQGIFLPLKRDIGFNTLRWIINGKYEQAEIEIIKKRIEPEDKILEIGSGLGFVTAFCSKKVGSDRVFSFEANPFNFEIALLVFEKNNVKPKIQNSILSDKNGAIDFYVDRKSRLASSILHPTNEIKKIPQLNLNEIIKTLKPNFLIMDIEGAEYDIFRIINFQTINKIQVELHPAILGEKKINEIFVILKKNGFVTDISSPDGRNYFFKK